MKALRIILTQNSANYKKEETSENKMTYPLPPFSTIIGALHETCNYKEYHPMDISIQGNFGSLVKRAYTDYCYLNRVMDDRGILIKMSNSDMLSKACLKLANAKNSTGNSFKDETTIQVHNRGMLDGYQDLEKLRLIIDEKKTEYKDKTSSIKLLRKDIKERLKLVEKKSDEYNDLKNQDKSLKDEIDRLNKEIKTYEEENYKIPRTKYKSLTTSLKFYEILHDIKLIIHIKTDDQTLSDIYDNIYNLKSIGRSEDFVDIEQVKLVELVEDDDCDITSPYSSYLNYEDVINEKIYTRDKIGREIIGTKYHLNKNYTIINNKRVFEKKKVIYASNYTIDETSENVFIDKDDDNEYIINFV